MSDNPYAAPSAPLEPARSDTEMAALAWHATRRVPASRGARWLFESWPMFRDSWLAWVLTVVIFFAITILVQFVPLVGAVVANAINPVLVAGIMYGCAAQTRGEPFQVEHLFAAFSDGKLASYLLLALLQVVLVIIAMFGIASVVLSSAELAFALSIPGAVPELNGTAIAAILLGLVLAVPFMGLYYFAPTLIALGNLDLMGAIKHSVLGAIINFLPLLVLAIIGTIAMVIAVIPVGLGLLVLVPMAFIASFGAYRDIYTQP